MPRSTSGCATSTSGTAPPATPGTSGRRTTGTERFPRRRLGGGDDALTAAACEVAAVRSAAHNRPFVADPCLSPRWNARAYDTAAPVDDGRARHPTPSTTP